MSIRSSIQITFAVLALVAGGTAFAAQGTACPNGKMSKQIAKPMTAALEALKKQKWREVLAKTKEAKAVQFSRSAFDEFWLHEFEGYAYISLGQPQDAAREWEAVIASPCATASDKVERYKALAGIYLNAKNYAKAIDYYNKVLAAGRDPEVMAMLGQAYFQSGDNKNATRVMNDVLTIVEQSGKQPKEQMLINVLNACERAGDRACVTKMYEKLVVYYPKPAYWQNLTSKIMGSSELSDEQKINVMRLALAVDVMKDFEQYKEMAQIALDRGLPAEALAIIDQAKAKNITKDKRQADLFDRLSKSAQAEITKDKATFTKKESDAKTADTGDAYVKLGASYLSYGDNAKAVEALKAGIAKGKLTQPDEAGLLLGMAHLRSNNKPEAAKAFKTVSKDPMMVRTAKLWLLNT